MIEKIIYWQGRCDICGNTYIISETYIFSEEQGEPLVFLKKELNQLLENKGWMKGKNVVCPECKSASKSLA